MDRIYIFKIREVDKEIFEAIKNSQKKIETRAATEKYKKIKVGDIVKFVCGNRNICKKVEQIAIFKTIKDLAEKYQPQEINPKIFSVKELQKMYDSFPGYKEKIRKYGLIAMKLV